MLTAIEIENFKAFGERQRIDLRPITLLFGPNSGGKSSVVHALHYFREVIVEGNINAHRTWSGGDWLDLGGARNFVHGQQLGTTIRLKADFTLDGVDLPLYFDRRLTEDEAEDYEETVKKMIKAATVEIEIDTRGEPFLRKYAVTINGEPLAELVTEHNKPHSEIRAINWFHSILLRNEQERDLAILHRSIDQIRSQLEQGLVREDQKDAIKAVIEKQEEINETGPYVGILTDLIEATGFIPVPGFTMPIQRPKDGLPKFDKVLVLSLVEERLVALQEAYLTETNEKDRSEKLSAFYRADSARYEFTCLLSMLLLGPGAVLAKLLKDFRYVGPLRSMPPRHSEPQVRGGHSRWPNGTGAWETLAYGPDKLRQEVSEWLESKERLDTGHRLERRLFKQVPTETVDLLVNPNYVDVIDELAAEVGALPEHTRVVLRDVGRNLPLQPQDVGVGLSQAVPVMVSLMAPGANLIALEQPELHLHPKQQAAMGDALIQSLKTEPGRVLLIETHSEHLILRLLRRIRETNRKQAPSDFLLTPDQFRVLYVHCEQAMSRVQNIDVDVKGDLVDPWPDDFFEQDFKERFS